eukprot:scaffold14401_cov58-Cyclotella_meneghiniana.AAC.26
MTLDSPSTLHTLFVFLPPQLLSMIGLAELVAGSTVELINFPDCKKGRKRVSNRLNGRLSILTSLKKLNLGEEIETDTGRACLRLITADAEEDIYEPGFFLWVSNELINGKSEVSEPANANVTNKEQSDVALLSNDSSADEMTDDAEANANVTDKEQSNVALLSNDSSADEMTDDAEANANVTDKEQSNVALLSNDSSADEMADDAEANANVTDMEKALRRRLFQSKSFLILHSILPFPHPKELN